MRLLPYHGAGTLWLDILPFRSNTAIEVFVSELLIYIIDVVSLLWVLNTLSGPASSPAEWGFPILLTRLQNRGPKRQDQIVQ